MDPNLQALATLAGIHFMNPNARFQKPGTLAMDADASLVTQSNAGIPAFLSTWIDPHMIEVIIAPNKATTIVGKETKKGDWTTTTAMFPIVESTGEVSSYGDYSDQGKSGVNVNFPERQSYHYQIITEYGEKELAIAALGKIDLANRKNIASVTTLNKFQNKTYFFGVAGLKLFGLLNDPSLTASIAPVADATAGNATTFGAMTAAGIFACILALFKQLQTQTGNNSLIEMDAKMTLAMDSGTIVNLAKLSTYNVSVRQMLKEAFPNMTIETAPEYAMTAGNMVQLIVDEVEGQQTAETAFTEKLRAHPVIVEMSAFKQKKSQGTWGTIIFAPLGIASMFGV